MEEGRTSSFGVYDGATGAILPKWSYMGCKSEENMMSNIIKIFSLICVPIFFWSSALSLASAGNGEINIEFRGQSMSAELKGASLEQVLETLKRKKGIWFEAPKSLLEEKVSILFQDLPLEEGFRRIIFQFNHALVFNRDKRLIGLFLFGKIMPGELLGQDARTFAETLRSQPEKEATVKKNPFELGSFRTLKSSRRPKTKSPDTEIGKKFPFPENPKTEMGGANIFKGSPSSENPFAGKTSQPSENPFGANPFGTSLESKEEALWKN
jgi:hypothetical protein